MEDYSYAAVRAAVLQRGDPMVIAGRVHPEEIWQFAKSHLPAHERPGNPFLNASARMQQFWLDYANDALPQRVGLRTYFGDFVNSLPESFRDEGNRRLLVDALACEWCRLMKMAHDQPGIPAPLLFPGAAQAAATAAGDLRRPAQRDRVSAEIISLLTGQEQTGTMLCEQMARMLPQYHPNVDRGDQLASMVLTGRPFQFQGRDGELQYLMATDAFPVLVACAAAPGWEEPVPDPLGSIGQYVRFVLSTNDRTSQYVVPHTYRSMLRDEASQPLIDRTVAALAESHGASEAREIASAFIGRMTKVPLHWQQRFVKELNVYLDEAPASVRRMLTDPASGGGGSAANAGARLYDFVCGRGQASRSDWLAANSGPAA